MTAPSRNDSDNLCPCERYILDKAKKLQMPFCYADFTDRYKRGTIRNAFLPLKKKGKIVLKTRSICAFYSLPEWDKNLPIPRISKKITSSLMEVGGLRYNTVKIDLMSFLESCKWEDLRHIHDVRLEISCGGLWQIVSKIGGEWGEPEDKSLDISRSPLKWCGGREALITVHHSDEVTVLVSCHGLPIEVSVDSILALAAFLGEIRQVLAPFGVSVPPVPSWTVVCWHYSRDGVPIQELAGKSFTATTFDEWIGTYLRFYLNKVTKKARIEAVERLRKPFSRAIEEKLAPDSILLKYAERIIELLERQKTHDATQLDSTAEAVHITADSPAEIDHGKENLKSGLANG